MSNYAPSPEDVAKTFLMARTRDAHGNLLGNFTADTAVTPEQAQRAIDEALDEVGGEIGADVSGDNIGQAKRLTMLLAAANIELSHFPEQAAANNSMYDKLMTRYNSILSSMSTETSEGDISDLLTSGGGFPPSQRWDTRPL